MLMKLLATVGTGRKEGEKLTLQDLPEPAFYTQWQINMQTTITAFSNQGDKCLKWINKVNKPGTTMDDFAD